MKRGWVFYYIEQEYYKLYKVKWLATLLLHNEQLLNI